MMFSNVQIDETVIDLKVIKSISADNCIRFPLYIHIFENYEPIKKIA